MLQYSSLNDAWGHIGTKSKPEQFSQAYQQSYPQPVPSQPVPSQPVPSQPVPSQPEPSQPVPSQSEQFSRMQPLETFTCGQYPSTKTFEFLGIKVNITKDMLTIILILLVFAIFIQLLYLIKDSYSVTQEKYYMITSSELNKIITLMLLDKSLGGNFNQISSI